LLDGCRIEAEREADGGGGEGVVDVVEARQAECGLDLAERRLDGNFSASGASQRYACRLDARPRSGEAAARAGVSAQVAVVADGVGERGPASRADPGIRGVGYLAVAGAGVTDSEEDSGGGLAWPEGGHERIVGVEHQRRIRWEVLDRLCPEVGNEV